MKLLILLTTLSLFSANTYSEVYKWTDENGKIRYGDSKPASIKSKKLDIKISPPERATVLSTPPEKVLMYATTWCGYCKKARKYFRKNNIPYIEYDIEQDAEAKRQYKNLGGNGVPLILYENRRMTGFSQDRFRLLYKPS